MQKLMASCISFLGLPLQSTTNRMVYTTEMYYLTILEDRSPRCRSHLEANKESGWRPSEDIGKASVPGPSPWLVDGRVLPVYSWLPGLGFSIQLWAPGTKPQLGTYTTCYPEPFTPKGRIWTPGHKPKVH